MIVMFWHLGASLKYQKKSDGIFNEYMLTFYGFIKSFNRKLIFSMSMCKKKKNWCKKRDGYMTFFFVFLHKVQIISVFS
jgi:hypothetical protein